jgi:hypothetical protein
MAQVIPCPGPERVREFLLGLLPDGESQALEQHLTGCDACLRAAQAMRAEDALVATVREAAPLAAGPAPPEVEQTVARLQGLWLDVSRAAAGDFTVGDTPPTDPPEGFTASIAVPADAPTRAAPIPAGPAPAPEAYDFLAPPQAPGELGRLAHYRVLRVLGAGGMGVVFHAEDTQLERPVALKAMRPAAAAAPSARERFLREARAAAAIEHDHIVPIYQVGEDRGVPYMAMQLLRGESLEDRARRANRLPAAEVLRVGREVAEGLAAAHARGLVHRDVKPANVWLTPEGRVKLLDFGLVRAAAARGPDLTLEGVVVGTPAYMAPEQASGGAVDARSDLFALGCVLYRLAAGDTPFRGEDPLATLVAVATREPRPLRELRPDFPPALSDLVTRLLAKDPAGRPQTAQAVVEAVREIESGEGATEAELPRPAPARRPPDPDVRPARRGGRRRRLLWSAAAVLAALGAGAWWFGPAVVRYATDRGDLVVEIDDPEVEAVARQSGLTIRDRATGREYTVRVGAQDVRSGAYEVTAAEAGGMRVSTREFTIVRGDRTTVRGTAAPAPPDFQEAHGVDGAGLQAWVNRIYGEGFRAVFLSVEFGSDPPRFCAVAVRNAPRVP